MVKFLVSAGTNRNFVANVPLYIDFPSGRVSVVPDETATLPNGKTVLRRVRTGKKRKRDDHDRLDLALYMLAARLHFGNQGHVEAVLLVDELIEDVALTDQKLSTWHTKSNEYVTAISKGAFPADGDPYDCPRCPHFFICDSMPRGPLDLSMGKK